MSLERIPDETTILYFRRLLENNELAAGTLGVINGCLGDRGLVLRQGTIVDAKLIHAPSSTKNKEGNEHYLGAKMHIGGDVELGLLHHVHITSTNVTDVTEVDKFLLGEENMVAADAGYKGVEKREEHEGRKVIWRIAARRSAYEKNCKKSVLYKAYRSIEKAKAQTHSRVEHQFSVIKRQFGYTKVWFRGLVKNTVQMVTLTALSNLWTARRHLLATAGEVHL